jgi:hypothetical protein
MTVRASRRWFDLIPDQAHVVVTAGYGTFTDSGALGDSDYATAARTPDGALAMAYMPTVRTITVDMTKLGAQAYASWYDPTRATFTPIAGSPFPNTGSRTFTPPGNNGDGDGDWVLVLEATSVPPDTQAPSIPTGLSATVDSSSQVTLSWAPSTDNVGVANSIAPAFRSARRRRRTPTWACGTTYSYTARGMRLRQPRVGRVHTALVTTTSRPNVRPGGRRRRSRRRAWSP